MAPGEFLQRFVMLTLKIAGVLVGIRDVRWVFLWFGCINPSGTSSLLARAGVALPGAGPFLRNFGDHFLLSSMWTHRLMGLGLMNSLGLSSTLTKAIWSI